MFRFHYFLWIFLLGLAASITLACGAGVNPPRQILALTVSPSSADAQDFPDGQVPFVATGIFNTRPETVTPLPATWVVIDQDGKQTTEVSINNGLAQCASGASGAYTVGAWDLLLIPPGAFCNLVTPFGNPCGDSVLGTAQLTCP